MNNQFVSKDFSAVVMKHSCQMKEYPVKIPQAFEELHRRMHEIPNHSSVTVAFYEPGNTSPRPEDIGVWYVGVLTNDNQNIPVGMEYRTLPTRKYASGIHKGKIFKIGDTYMSIGAWVNQQGKQLDSDWVIECYDDRFNPMSDESELEIYMPIKDCSKCNNSTA